MLQVLSSKKRNRYFARVYYKINKNFDGFKNKIKVELTSNIINKLPMVKVELNSELNTYA